VNSKFEDEWTGGGALTKLASAEDDDMSRIGIREHLAASLIAAKRDSWSVIINGVRYAVYHMSGSITDLGRDPCAPEHAQVLVHVEWFAADPIRFEDSRTEVMDETQ
jgi:hypothetical protein